MESEELFATARSGLPSPLKSPLAMDCTPPGYILGELKLTMGDGEPTAFAALVWAVKLFAINPRVRAKLNRHTNNLARNTFSPIAAPAGTVVVISRAETTLHVAGMPSNVTLPAPIIAVSRNRCCPNRPAAGP
jgi:hypothetical protein